MTKGTSPFTTIGEGTHTYSRCNTCGSIWAGGSVCPLRCTGDRAKEMFCYLQIFYRSEKNVGGISNSHLIVHEDIYRSFLPFRRADLTDIQTIVLREKLKLRRLSVRGKIRSMLIDDYQDTFTVTRESLEAAQDIITGLCVVWQMGKKLINPGETLTAELSIACLAHREL